VPSQYFVVEKCRESAPSRVANSWQAVAIPSPHSEERSDDESVFATRRFREEADFSLRSK
jgi:hypothetical protein